MYFLIGSLQSEDTNPPRFAQFYIYNIENGIQNRKSTLSIDESSNSTATSILEKLIKMLDKTNVLVKLFNTVRDHDKFIEINLPSIRLRLIGRRNHNSSQFNLLTSNDIGGLIIGDIGEYKKERYNYRNKN